MLSTPYVILRRMATYALERIDLFPEGTVVKVFPYSGFRLSQGGAPTAKELTSATVSSGKAEFSGLTAGANYTAYAAVSGTDVYDKFTVDVAAPAQSVASLLSFHGLLGWSFDPLLASSSKILGTAGTLHVTRVWIPEACTITNIHEWTTVAGATLTANENGLGVFQEGTRKLIGKVLPATLITAWEAAAGEVKVPLETPVAVGAGYVLIGQYFKGTTAPTLAASVGTVATQNVNRSANTSRFGTADTGLTTALPSTMGTITALAEPYWVGVS